MSLSDNATRFISSLKSIFHPDVFMFYFRPQCRVLLHYKIVSVLLISPFAKWNRLQGQYEVHCLPVSNCNKSHRQTDTLVIMTPILCFTYYSVNIHTFEKKKAI